MERRGKGFGSGLVRQLPLNALLPHAVSPISLSKSMPVCYNFFLFCGVRGCFIRSIRVFFVSVSPMFLAYATPAAVLYVPSLSNEKRGKSGVKSGVKVG